MDKNVYNKKLITYDITKIIEYYIKDNIIEIIYKLDCEVKHVFLYNVSLILFFNLFLFSGNRSPPTSFDLKNFKLNGGNQMERFITFEVDGNELFADFDNRKYFIKFKNYENEEIMSEISEAIFYTYLTSKKKYKSNENEEYRHWEHIALSDNELYHRAFLKEQKVDEIIEKKEMYDEIHRAIELLSKSQKNKIIEYYFKEKNMIEILKENNISKQAVSKSLKDSYEILREI